MPHINLALLGFGNVGQALAQLLLRKQNDLKSQYNISFAVTAIGTGRHGAAIDPDGINLKQAITVMNSNASLDTLSTLPVPKDGLSLIEICGAVVLFDHTPVNYESGLPARDLVRRA